MKRKVSDFIKYFTNFFFLITFVISGWNIIFYETSFCWIELDIAIMEFIISLLAIVIMNVEFFERND